MIMKYCLLFLLLSGTMANAQRFSLSSPDGKIALTTQVNAGGNLVYQLSYKNKEVLLPSALSFELKEPATSLSSFNLLKADSSMFDQTWKPVWGEYATIRDQHKELVLHLQQKAAPGILINIVFRVFNEGLAFQYVFPKQKNLDHFVIADEKSSFRLNGDHTAFWIPGDYDSNEFPYYHTKLSAVDAEVSKTYSSIFAKTFFTKRAVQTPLMMKSDDGLYINIHEAALVNYPAMNLVIDPSTNLLTSHLVPDAVGNKAYLQTPAKTPWRTVIVSDDAREILAANRMILNLNEPSVITNTTWIRPQKFVGVWWEMHVGKSTWEKSSGRHGATTANVKRYIDFAEKNGFQGVLVEGWNVGWED